MSVPFTYLVFHKPTRKAYYGVRFAKGCSPEDLWSTYFTSSTRVKKLIEEYGTESFHVEIRKTFKDVESALAWEYRVLRRLDLKNGIWLNSYVCQNIKIMTSEQAHFNWSSEEYRRRQTESQKQTWSNPDLRTRHSEICKTLWNEKRRKEQSERTRRQWDKQDKQAVAAKMVATKKAKGNKRKPTPKQTYSVTMFDGTTYKTRELSELAKQLGTSYSTMFACMMRNGTMPATGVRSITVIRDVTPS